MERQGQCIAVVSGKGGTGKTSFTAGVGAALALSGRRVLCLDCDVGLRNLDLALGLSDEVQMSTGIRLDTLFVDEGFGSLDSEALSKAYLTLAGLTEGNRLVGIISHVAELKEKIDAQ